MCDDQERHPIDIFEGILCEDAPRTPVDKDPPACGTVWQHYFSHINGRPQWFPLLCGKFRECPVCHKKRMDEFIKRIDRAIYLQDKIVCVLPLSDPRVPEIIKGLDKSDYLRLPAEQNGALFFNTCSVDGEYLVGAQSVTMASELPAEFDWDDLTNTPEGSRPSGGLGKEEKEEEESGGEKVKINVAVLTIEQQEDSKVDVAMYQAVTETAHLDPKTPEEVEAAISERTDAAVRILTAMGITILGRSTIIRNMDISHISWQLNSSCPPHTQQNTAHPPNFVNN